MTNKPTEPVQMGRKPIYTDGSETRLMLLRTTIEQHQRIINTLTPSERTAALLAACDAKATGK